MYFGNTFQPAGSSLSFALNMTWYDRSLRLLLLILCTHILWLQSQQDNGAAWAYNQHIGICRGRSHSCTPHTEECVGMPYAACVCVVWWCVCVSGGGSMACCVFVYRRLQSVKAAFSSSAPLQTVYGGIPLRLSGARTMPSLGWWPNGFWRQWLTLHVTMRVGEKIDEL